MHAINDYLKKFTVILNNGSITLQYQDPWGDTHRVIHYKSVRSMLKYMASETASFICGGAEWQKEYDVAYKKATTPGRNYVDATHPAMIEHGEKWERIRKDLFDKILSGLEKKYSPR